MNDKYRFILAEKAGLNPGPLLNFSMKAFCRALNVSRSGLYEAQRRQLDPSSSTKRRHELDAAVKQVFHEERARYGSRRVHETLLKSLQNISRSSIARSMRRQALMAARRRPFRVTTDSNHGRPVAPNLLARDFNPARPNIAWCGDITYVHTVQGWLYVAVVLDLWSRRVVGYATSTHIDRHLVIAAMNMAVGQRAIKPGLIFHSDRGSQYASEDFVSLLKKYSISQSMSRKGDCWDNAPSESFFSSLKQEGLQKSYPTRAEARQDVDQYMAWYNAHRLHSTLNYVSPMTFETKATRMAA